MIRNVLYYCAKGYPIDEHRPRFHLTGQCLLAAALEGYTLVEGDNHEWYEHCPCLICGERLNRSA